MEYAEAVKKVAKVIADATYGAYMSGSNNHWQYAAFNQRASVIAVIYDLDPKMVEEALKFQTKQLLSDLK